MNIYVYGTGCGAGELIDTALPTERVTAFVDSAPVSDCFLGKPVISPEQLAERDYDFIIVTTRQAEEVAMLCARLGIDGEKLLFLKNNFLLTDRNLSYETADQILGTDLTEKLRQSMRLIRTPVWSEKERLPEQELDNDYIRLKTLEAVCRRLNNVPGAAAELGVFRGNFARCINYLLPERKLYLFDTFEGFREQESADCSAGFVNAHRNTAAELVLASLPYPKQAVCRQGLFPESAEGLEERFALVSLDVDLEESSLAGLRWFLPRMNPGGYLLLHDYANPKLPGVQNALRRWETENRQRLHAVPLCDVSGTLVISL